MRILLVGYESQMNRSARRDPIRPLSRGEGGKTFDGVEITENALVRNLDLGHLLGMTSQEFARALVAGE